MIDDFSSLGFATRAIHGHYVPDSEHGCLVPPIYQTTSYVFKNVEDGAKKCESVDYGHCYTRLSNPTQSILEKNIAELEGGEAGVAFGSGVAAISAVLFNQFKMGDHAIADETSYSATYYLFDNLLRRFGVETTFVDSSDPKNVERAIRPNTKLIYFETPANPTLKVVDIVEVAKIGKAHNIITVMDNTFASPYLQKPLGLGIDIVIHSATKYICGHGDAMGGVVVSKKKIVDEIINDTLKNLGGIISPFNCFLILRGLKTLDIRMEKHCKNAMKVAEFLEGHNKIERVFYPGLISHPQHEIAKKQMKDFGGIVCFEVKGGVQGGVTVMESIKVCTLAVSVGDCESLLEHPASMTHWYVPREERIAAGISDGLVRMSVGLEDVDDIINDLDQALGKIQL